MPPWLFDFTVAAGGYPDPRGGTTAWLVTCIDALGGGLYTSFFPTPSNDVCLSLYAKEIAVPDLYLGIFNITKAGFDAQAAFNLTDLTAIAVGGLTIVNQGIKELSDGWRRCWVSASPVYGTISGMLIYFNLNDSHYIYNMQLSRGLVLPDELKTQEVQLS